MNQRFVPVKRGSARAIGAVILAATMLAHMPSVVAQVADCTGRSDGASCTDGDPCTYGETCQSGACVGGWPITCVSDACATRACNGTSTCAVLSVAPDGTPCDDANACTSGDTCKAGGCAGMLVDNGVSVRRLAPGSTTSVITWNVPAGATSFDVVRGFVSHLPVSPGGVFETPLVQNQSGSVTADSTVPSPGEGYWYLVRARNACGPGPWGFEADHGRASLPEVTSGGCVVNTSASPRYVDNGLTVTDRQACLEWEKKTVAPGLNNENNVYNWGHYECCSDFIPDGPLYTVFVPALNAGRFARHHDWRIPSGQGPITAGAPGELESILLSPYPCGIQPCIDPIFGPTVSDYYWSSSFQPGDLYPNYGIWAVSFSSGRVSDNDYTTIPYARAVRGGQ